jgi:predicted  nucleic acid-binding Zn-ribbon protein
MKYYSDVTKKMYDTLEDAKKAEEIATRENDNMEKKIAKLKNEIKVLEDDFYKAYEEITEIIKQREKKEEELAILQGKEYVNLYEWINKNFPI